jgi:hypothetical protein
MRTSTLGTCTKLFVVLAVVTLLAGIALAIVAGVGYTTFDAVLGGCLDSPNGINCNNYVDKNHVYMSGGPTTAAGLSDGSYFFAVIVPGFQNGGFIDGASGNLSDTAAGSTAGDLGSGDDVSNRTFTVAAHEIVAYSGTHATGTSPNGKFIIALSPYDDTSNTGGVYILAICLSGATSPSQCKYDAFRVPPGNQCTQDCGGTATLTVCKFWDQNIDHVLNDEPLLGNWPFTATNVDGNGTAVTQNTGNLVVDGHASLDLGCTTFIIIIPSGLPTNSVDVTLTEGNLPGNGSVYCTHDGCPLATPNPTGPWTQTAPVDKSNNVLTSEKVTVSPGDTKIADPFGNFTGFDLTVSKTAAPSFTRKYLWNITKDVDKTLVEKIGGTATFNYTVVASETGFNDSAWEVTGTITVANTNGFAVSGVTVTDDDTADGGSCTVTGGTNVTVPAGGSSTLSYTCTYSSNPGTGTNTAFAAWDATKFSTPHNSASGQAGFTFGAPTTLVDNVITVTDTFNSTTTTLGTVTATDTQPFATKTFTYSHTVNVPASNCVFYTNTATFTTNTTNTTGSASQTIEVCGPAATGALTMGFWQNKNGQGIILNHSGASCLALKAYLNGYDPFSDLTATTCGSSPSLGAKSASGVVGYVYAVIKNATCSGPSSSPCNAMLKAQMLATALDVYFSATGNNWIGAPGPIGNVPIDLTNVCNMIDGSGGTASCSGVFTDVRALFGVVPPAKCLAVSGMLSYQNTADPLADAGAVWYLNVKANQVGAKNAFDAVNNKVAFSPSPCP